MCNHLEYYTPNTYNNTAIKMLSNNMKPWKQKQHVLMVQYLISLKRFSYEQLIKDPNTL